MRKAFLTTDHANFLNRRRDTHNTHSALSLSPFGFFFFWADCQPVGAIRGLRCGSRSKSHHRMGIAKHLNISISQSCTSNNFQFPRNILFCEFVSSVISNHFFFVYRCYDLEREEMPGLASPAWHDFIFTNRLQMNNLREEKKTQENE